MSSKDKIRTEFTKTRASSANGFQLNSATSVVELGQTIKRRDRNILKSSAGARIFRTVKRLRQAFDSQLLADAIFQASGEAIMVMDENNLIKHVNPAFTRLTGYELPEVIGKNPRILTSGRHDKTFFQAMWQDIKNKKHWQGNSGIATKMVRFMPDG